MANIDADTLLVAPRATPQLVAVDGIVVSCRSA
jgi:hypothetical protein